jgi:hypothetical protein
MNVRFSTADMTFLKASGISSDEISPREDFHELLDASRKRELAYMEAVANLHVKLAKSLAREEQWIKWRKQACAERDQAKQSAETWRRRFLWVVLPPTCLALAAFWGIVIGRLWR